MLQNRELCEYVFGNKIIITAVNSFLGIGEIVLLFTNVMIHVVSQCV